MEKEASIYFNVAYNMLFTMLVHYESKLQLKVLSLRIDLLQL